MSSFRIQNMKKIDNIRLSDIVVLNDSDKSCTFRACVSSINFPLADIGKIGTIMTGFQTDADKGNYPIYVGQDGIAYTDLSYLDTYVVSAQYDSELRKIVLYFADSEETKIYIDVHELVNIYKADEVTLKLVNDTFDVVDDALLSIGEYDYISAYGGNAGDSIYISGNTYVNQQIMNLSVAVCDTQDELTRTRKSIQNGKIIPTVIVSNFDSSIIQYDGTNWNSITGTDKFSVVGTGRFSFNGATYKLFYNNGYAIECIRDGK